MTPDNDERERTVVTKRDNGSVKRRGARAWSALALTAALVAATVLIAPRLVPTERLSPRVAEALAAVTGARVEVGAARLTLIGGLGLQVTDLRIELENRYALRLDRVDVSLAVWPLLRREMVVDGVRARGSAAMISLPTGDLEAHSFTLDAGHLNLTLAAPGSGSPPPPTAARAGPRWPADLRGKADLTVATLTRSGVTWTDVRLEASLRQQVLEVRRLEGRCGQGSLRATASFDPARARPGRLIVAAEIERLLPAHLLRPLTQAADWDAQVLVPLTGTISLACTPGDAATWRSTLTAEGHLGAVEGLVRATDWLAGVQQYLGDRQDLTDIRVETLRHAFRIAGGTCQVDTLTVDGPDTAWDIGGSVGLDGALDLAIHLRLPPDFTPRMGSMTFFAEVLRDQDRRVNLDLRLKGPLPDPAVSLDLSRLSKKRAG